MKQNISITGMAATKRNKYSIESTRASSIYIPDSIEHKHAALLKASLSTSSWNKHLSALHCFQEFQHYTGRQYSFPLDNKSVCDFVLFAVEKRKLKHSTVNAYLSSLAFYHRLRDLNSESCSNFLAKSMVKGAKNLELYSAICKDCRKVMTLPLLKLLSHKIATESWSDIDKQSFWTAFTVAFYGSFRFGEILSQNGRILNKKETLLWSDIKFGKDYVVIHIKITKTKSRDGEYVDLFLQEDNKYCPVKALKRLKSMIQHCTPETPVFKLDNGSLLTPARVNTTLQQLLTPVIGHAAKLITGHSFRAALPSALASQPDVASSEDIRIWGRWNSNSYALYTRLKLNQKREIYKKIISVLELQ
jgi:hypothetical protein